MNINIKLEKSQPDLNANESRLQQLGQDSLVWLFTAGEHL